MNRSRLLAIISVVGMLLALFVVGSGLAQAPNADSEPDVPLYSAEREGSGPSSLPPAFDSSAARAVATSEPTEAQRNSSGPIAAGLRVTEQLPEGIGATTAIADLRIAGSVLKPRTNNVDYDWASGGGCVYATAGDSFTIFHTGLYLPQGSNVLALRMYYNDTSADDSIGWFSIFNLYGDLVQEWVVHSEGNSGNGFNDTETISHTIDYSLHSYVVQWRPTDLGSDTQLCGFRIFYEPPARFGAFLPSTTRNEPAP